MTAGRRVIRASDLQQQLERGPLSRGYLFCGPESLLRDEGIAAVRARLAPAGDLDVDRFQAGETPLSAAASALQTVGLFASHRMVVISDLERAGRAAAAERDALIRALSTAGESSVLVCASDLPWRELERRSELARRLAESCVVVELWRLRPDEAMRWLLAESRRRGLRLSADAGAYLVEHVGPDLQELSRELEKLEAWAEAGAAIGIEDVRTGLRHGIGVSLWDFCDLVMAGGAAEALGAWEGLKTSEPVLRVQWQIQRKARDLLARGTRSDADGRLGLLLLGGYFLERAIKTGRIRSGDDETGLSLLVAEAAPLAARRGPSQGRP